MNRGLIRAQESVVHGSFPKNVSEGGDEHLLESSISEGYGEGNTSLTKNMTILLNPRSRTELLYPLDYQGL